MKALANKIYIIFGLSGPIFYFLLLIFLGLMWNGYDPISTGMSELGAVDSPFRDVMNYLGFSLLGLSIVLFSIGFAHYFGKELQIRIAQTLLFFGGFTMFLVGFFPCDSNCIDVTQIGKIHSLLSTISAILIPLGLISSAYPISKKWNRTWGYTSFYLGILSLASGPIMFLDYSEAYVGLIQRLGIGLSLLWIVSVSWKIIGIRA